MKKILVTGSNGFIAKHVILELYKKNYSVIGTVRNLDYSDTIKNDIETHLGKSIDIEFVKADLNSDGELNVIDVVMLIELILAL